MTEQRCDENLVRLAGVLERDSHAVVLVVGAGVTLGALGSHPCAAHLRWSGLLEHGVRHAVERGMVAPAEAQTLCEWARSGSTEQRVDAADRLVAALGGGASGAYRAWLKGVFEEVEVRAEGTQLLDEISNWSQLGVRIATTNYDGVLERHLGLDSVCWPDTAEVEAVLRGEQEAVVHLHGHWKRPQSVVLGSDGYDRLGQDAHYQSLVQAVRTLGTMVFVGVGGGMEDPDLGRLRRWAKSALSASSSSHYWLRPEAESLAADAAELLAERTTSVTYAEPTDIAPLLADVRARSGRRVPASEPGPRLVLLLLNVDVWGDFRPVDLETVRQHCGGTIASQDVAEVSDRGEPPDVDDPRWWDGVASKVRAAVNEAAARVRELGSDVELVVAGHAPQSVFALAGHVSQRLSVPIRFVNRGLSGPFERIEAGERLSPRVSWEVRPASDESLQPSVRRYGVFVFAGGSKACSMAEFDAFKGSAEDPLARSLGALSTIMSHPRPGVPVERGVASVGAADLDEAITRTLAELDRLRTLLPGAQPVVGYRGPAWGAFELGRALRHNVVGEVEFAHFVVGKERSSYVPAVALRESPGPLWIRKPRVSLFAAEPTTTSRVQGGRTLTAIVDVLKHDGFQCGAIDLDGGLRHHGLYDRLLRAQPHVIYVQAHGGEGALALQNLSDQSDRVGADAWVEALRKCAVPPLLVVLAACNTVALGERLVEAADHVVVAQGKLQVQIVEVFARKFFRLLAKGRSLRDAFDIASRIDYTGKGWGPQPQIQLLSAPGAVDAARVRFCR